MFEIFPDFRLFFLPFKKMDFCVFLLTLFGFLDILDCLIFGFGIFFVGGIPFNVTKVTTKINQGYYWTPKNPKMGQNCIISPFFARGGKKPRPKAKGLRRS